MRAPHLGASSRTALTTATAPQPACSPPPLLLPACSPHGPRAPFAAPLARHARGRYTLLILMNMLHFAGTREEQKQVQQQELAGAGAAASPAAGAAGAAAATAAGGAAGEAAPEIDVDDALAAMASLPEALAVDSGMVSSADISNDEKLQASYTHTHGAPPDPP